MIVGNGMLAKKFEHFRDDPSVLIFASGVSNSQEKSIEAFRRESDLLAHHLGNFRGASFIYFGSCGVSGETSKLSPYLKHKRSMEQHVLDHSTGRVFRLPQVVGSTDNPHTLTNFLRDRILNGESFEVWREAERNLIDMDDVAAIASTCIAKNYLANGSAYSIASERSLKMEEIIAIFQRVLNKQANYTSLPKGEPMLIEANIAATIAPGLGIDLGVGYAERVISKYYGKSAVSP